MVRDLRGDSTSAWGAMRWAADLLVIGLFRNWCASIGQGCRSAHFECPSATLSVAMKKYPLVAK
jgi:hypothetical protein